MRVNSVKRVSFNGKIIDSHGHLGKWGPNYYSAESFDVFTRSALKNGDTVEKIIVSNSSCLDSDGIVDEITGNKQILEISSQNSKIVPIAVCQPNLTGGNSDNIEQLLKENPNKFVGLKFHPKCMELAANDKLYDNYMQVAEKYGLPCLFHTDKTFDVKYPDGSIGSRCSYSRPDQVYELAKRHKDVPVIFAHMGGNEGENTKAAVDILIDSIENNTAKIYADISWVNAEDSYKKDIVEAIKRLKNTSKGDMTERLMFGTDAPIGRFGNTGENGMSPYEAYSKVVEDIKSSIKLAFSSDEADVIIDKIFYKNAKDIFFKSNTESSKPVTHSLLKKNKIFLMMLIIGGILAVAGVSLRNNIFQTRDKK